MDETPGQQRAGHKTCVCIVCVYSDLPYGPLHAFIETKREKRTEIVPGVTLLYTLLIMPAVAAAVELH